MDDYIIHIDSYDFEEKLERGTALVFFYEYMDTKSMALETVMEEIAENYGERINIYAVDIEQSPDIAIHYGVENIPCVIFLKNGDTVEQIDGANPPDIYTDIIEEVIDE